MNYIKFCSIFLILLFIVQTESNRQCGIRKHSFVQLVYHGWRIEEGYWPWHVAIMHKSHNESFYACGGTLIDRRHVLTAAHCVVNRKNNYPMSSESLLLHLGISNLSNMTKHVQVRDVGKIHVHPDFSPRRNDIAMLELRLPVEFTDFVTPICLDTLVDRDLRNLEGQRGWVAGWGMTENGTGSNELRTASLPVVTYLQCVQADPVLYGNLLNENSFCAGDRNGTSPGTGDSGGGMYFLEGDRWVLRGIVSFAKVDETRLQVDTSKYAVFVNVQRFLSWIREVSEDQTLNSTASGVVKRISERECDRFKNLVEKRSNGICSNARHLHIVSLISHKGRFSCTGILLNENNVLTSALCFQNYTCDEMKVHISGHGSFNISSFIRHPEYKIQYSYHNIAIAKLESSARLWYGLIPACLASNWTENLYDSLVVSGYKLEENSEIQYFFESDANHVLSKVLCSFYPISQRTFRNDVSPSQLCVTNNDKLLGSGFGSSGSPLQTFNPRTCMFTVVGILFAESEDRSIDFYNRVAYYLDWIEETVWGEKAVSTTTTTSPLEESSTTEKSSFVNDFVFPSD